MDGDIAKLGFEVNSAQLAAANENLQKLPPSAAKAEGAVKKLESEFGRAERATLRFYTNLDRLAHGIGHTIGENLRTLAIGFGTVFAAGALVERITETARALDEVSKAARATNSSVASMQALQVAGNLAGVSVDYVAAATKRMNRVLGQAIATGKGNVSVYKELGISAKELAALPVDERFAKIGDRLKELNIPAAQAQAILAQLGDRGGQLINLLGQGGDEIRKAAGDVKRFGLALTDVQGKNVEEMNDAFTRLGYSVQGAFNQFIAFIAPTITTLFNGITTAVVFLVQNLGYIGPVLEIVGPMMLVAFGPAIVGAVISLAVAIGTNLVGAFLLLAGVIMANPLFALAALLVGAIAAIWVFRDQISKAIGVDVTQIFKDVGNTIIRVFMMAFATVKDIWMNAPSVIGGFAIDAANAVITAETAMINAAIDGLNSLMNTVRANMAWMASIPGIGPAAVGLVQGGNISHISDLPKFDNPFTSTNLKTAQDYQKTLKDIAQTDYVGQIAGSMKTLSDTATETTTTTGEATGSIEGLGAAAKKTKKPVDEAAKAVKELQDNLRETASGGLKTFLSDLFHGKSILDSFLDGLNNIADKLIDMLSNSIINNLFASLLGGAGGLSGGVLGAIGSIAPGTPIHFARGGVVSNPTLFKFASGTGLMGEAGPEAIMPLHRGPDGTLGVRTANQNGGGSQPYQINIINNNANDNTVSTKQNDDGSIDIQIDRKVANLISDRSSRTNKSLRNTLGTNNTVKTR